MRFRGPAAIAVTVLAATVIATAGAAANLHLLGPSDTLEPPIVLGVSAVNSTTTSDTTAPPGTVADPGEPTTTQAPPTTVAPPPTSTTVPPAGPRAYVVGGAGTVTLALRDGALVLESVVPGAGWESTVESQRADELEISFHRTGGEGEASFHASVRDGDIRVEIEPPEGESPDD